MPRRSSDAVCRVRVFRPKEGISRKLGGLRGREEDVHLPAVRRLRKRDEDRWGAAFTPDRSWEHLTAEGRRYILGLEAQLWGENGKTREIREYQAFPRLLGVAERDWKRRIPSP
jgi:hypothetical protein